MGILIQESYCPGIQGCVSWFSEVDVRVYVLYRRGKRVGPVSLNRCSHNLCSMLSGNVLTWLLRQNADFWRRSDVYGSPARASWEITDWRSSISDELSRRTQSIVTRGLWYQSNCQRRGGHLIGTHKEELLEINTLVEWQAGDLAGRRTRNLIPLTVWLGLWELDKTRFTIALLWERRPLDRDSWVLKENFAIIAINDIYIIIQHEFCFFAWV